MWEAFKKGYRGAGGPQSIAVGIGSALGRCMKVVVYTVVVVLTLQVLGVLP